MQHPIVIAALLTRIKTWKQPTCPLMHEWMKKMWYIYTMEYYSAIKRRKLLSLVTIWMNIEGIMLSEMSDRERQIPYDLTDLWNLKK